MWRRTGAARPISCDISRLKSPSTFLSLAFYPRPVTISLGVCAFGGSAHHRAGGRLAAATNNPVLPTRHGTVLFFLGCWAGQDHGAQRSGPRPGNEVFALRDKTGTRQCLVGVASTGSVRPGVLESLGAIPASGATALHRPFGSFSFFLEGYRDPLLCCRGAGLLLCAVEVGPRSKGNPVGPQKGTGRACPGRTAAAVKPLGDQARLQK